MLNFPSTRAAITLLRSFVVDPSRFLGITRVLPLDVVTQMNSEKVEWEVLGPHVGMVPPHQLGTEAALMAPEVLELKSMGTAYWRAKQTIQEQDFLRVARLGSDRQELARRELFVQRLYNLSVAIDKRMEYSVWQALDEALTYDLNGVEFTVTYGLPEAYEPDNFWNDTAAALPIADIQHVLRQFAGSGVSEVDIYYNGNIEGLLSRNEDILDRLNGSPFAMATGTGAIMDAVKSLVQGDRSSGSGPRIRNMVCYDEGYHVDASTFARFLPDDTLFFVGYGGPEYAEVGGPEMVGVPGRWMSTPALHDNFNAELGTGIEPGKYVTVNQHTNESPKYVALEGGIHGLPAIKRPNWIRRIRAVERE